MGKEKRLENLPEKAYTKANEAKTGTTEEKTVDFRSVGFGGVWTVYGFGDCGDGEFAGATERSGDGAVADGVVGERGGARRENGEFAGDLL